MGIQVSDMAARVIDFNAYKKRRQEKQFSGNAHGMAGGWHSYLSAGLAMPAAYWFFPVLMWVPVLAPVSHAEVRDLS